jgi:hypothetical protein
MPGATASRARGWHAITRLDPCNFLHTFRSHRAAPSSPGLSWGSPGALPGSPGALLGSEIVQMACWLPEPRAREDVMRSRVRTLANFCIRFAPTGCLQALLGFPGALLELSLGSPGLSWAPFGAVQSPGIDLGEPRGPGEPQGSTRSAQELS